LILFLLAYAVGTLVGFMAFMISETLMWVTIFTIMPVVFPVAFYQYLSRTHCPAARTGVEMVKLCSLWVVLSFGPDGIIYIAVLPLILRARPTGAFSWTRRHGSGCPTRLSFSWGI